MFSQSQQFNCSRKTILHCVHVPRLSSKPSVTQSVKYPQIWTLHTTCTDRVPPAACPCCTTAPSDNKRPWQDSGKARPFPMSREQPLKEGRH